MTKQTSPLLYTQVVQVTHVYLGPAADRFIMRQVENHLHKTPEDITKKDLLMLIDWIKVAVSLLTDDSEIVEEYALQLYKLAGPANQKTSKRSAK